MRCFLSYSFQTDISVIKKILSDLNVSYVNPVENLEYGSAITQTISRQIKNSDFVIAVLDDSTNVSFEIGFAMGSKKPIFVISSNKKENELPVFLTAVTYTLAAATDYDKIKYSLDIFLKQLPLKKELTVTQKPYLTAREEEVLKLMTQDYSIKDIAEKLMLSPRTIEAYRYNIREKISLKENQSKRLSNDYINSLGDLSKIRGIQFEELVGQLFKKLDLETFAQNRAKEKDFQADFSLWIDELNSIVGNPIIVETKSSSDQAILNDAVIRLSEHLKKYNSKVGFLIYNNPSDKQFNNLFLFSPLVISISIQELLQQLTEKSLSEIIIQLRNKAVHKEIF